jgi:hypothetical protein
LAIAGSVPAPAFPHDLRLQIDEQGAVLLGEIHNQSDLRLENLVLLAPGKAEPLGAFNPGESKNIQILLDSAARAAQSGASPGTNPGPYYFQPGISALEDILGTTDFYENEVTRQRYNLINAALNSGSGMGGRGSGTYLAGWSSDSPVAASLVGQDTTLTSTTLYLIAMDPTLDFREGLLDLPPALFTWNTLVPGPTENDSPYETWIYPGSYSLQFAVSFPISFTGVESLILHLKSYGAAGPSELKIWLWDHPEQRWELLPPLDWGDHPIPAPSRFVGPGGEIRLQLENSGRPEGIHLEAADFTLVVER